MAIVKERMNIDSYATCPCGSGKKFKWCCQPIYDDISRAQQQNADGQHEAALRILQDLTVAHADNPEAWGRYAELLFQNERLEDAEAAIAKALEINPSYPYGQYLRGEFRRLEGELAGALLLFRKAADLYDPGAREMLGHLYLLIFDCEMKLNRPIAARAAGELAFRVHPDAEVKKGLDELFGPANPNLPATAKVKYSFKPLSANASAERRAAWDKALATAGVGKLTDAVRAFEQLTQEDANDAPAWYNRAVALAWVGANSAAVDALNKYVALELNEDDAGAAWAFAEVLLCGQGCEDLADYVEYSIMAPLRDTQPFIQYLNELQKMGLITGARVSEEEGVLMAVILEAPPPALTEELAAKQNPRIGAFLVLMGNILRLWNTSQETLGRTFDALRQKVGASFGQEPIASRGPVKFQDILTSAIVAVRGAGSTEELTERFRAHLEKYFEEDWIHQPLKALAGTPPVDAAEHATLRKKLRGVVQFIEDCGSNSQMPYDFQRLRRKLNLAGAKTETAAATTDIAVMSARELAGVDIASLSDAHLDDAFQAALKLDAKELAGKYAQAIVQRPTRTEKPDRWLWHNHLIQLALNQSEFDAALDRVNDGERDDCENNQGRRRNDFELRRAQVHAKRGNHDEARDVFQRLIERVPTEMKYRATAAETMLSARQGASARKFAEAGLAEARKQNQRDLEGHFQELVEAAKRHGG